tara:strand:+ start:10406 stop:10894 length:489 start_codon:yes stop_codon:yes gene_type:complete
MRNKIFFKFIALFVPMFLVWLFSPNAYTQIDQKFSKTNIIINSLGENHKFSIELALTPLQQAQGLMYRTFLPENSGMLFDYGSSKLIRMWMKNTFISLDMVFINQKGQIIKIVERTIPKSESIISSNFPARAVLELNGGTIEKLKIKVGDLVKHKMFEPSDQ